MVFLGLYINTKEWKIREKGLFVKRAVLANVPSF